MKIKELLDEPSKWTKRVYARDKEGKPVHPEMLEARCWCLIGAICRCYSGMLYEHIHLIMSARPDISAVSQWNDDPDRTFEEVKSLVEELDI